MFDAGEDGAMTSLLLVFNTERGLTVAAMMSENMWAEKRRKNHPKLSHSR